MLTCKDNFANSIVTPQPSSYTPINDYISDTGATGIYLLLSHLPLLTTKYLHHKPIDIHLPDGSTMRSTASGKISLGNISPKALTAHLFPYLKSALLGTTQLCDHGMSVTYSKQFLTIHGPNNEILLRHPRSHKLWTIPTLTIPTTPQPIPTHTAYNAYPIEPNNSALCLFWQRVFFSPCKSTFVQAAFIPRFQKAFPTLTPTFIRKYYVHTAATAMGHLNRTRKILKTAKVNPYLTTHLPPAPRT